LSVLYLAEVHKKTGFMGVKTELKLLARQQSEQNWSTLPGEEMIPIEIANEYNAGVLVLVELDNNQQVKKVQDANRHLVGILKNFSRMREKFRTQEEEIEGWKQSLIYQSQELTRREVDIEVRSEELQQLESESQKIESQRQEFEATRAQILELKEEIERDRQQLEEAWGKLHSAQNQHAQAQKTALSDDQVQQLETLIGRLETTLGKVNEVHQPLQTLQLLQGEQQAILQQFWNQLEQDRGQVESAQSDLDRQVHDLEQGWQKWHQDQEALHQLQIRLRLHQDALAHKATFQGWLSQQVQAQDQIDQNLHRLQDGISGDAKVDLGSLRNLPLDELEDTVQKLQKELAKLYHFVSDQEEELKLQQQTIDELKTKINQSSEYDRLNLASDLEYEQQNYQLLEDTLQGQRQTLKDRDAVLKAHQDILSQRKGTADESGSDLRQQIGPLLQTINAQRQSLQGVLQGLEREQVDLQTTVQQTQGQIDSASTVLAEARANLEAQSKALDRRRQEVAQLTASAGLMQQILQPVQDKLTHLQQTLESVWHPLDATATEQLQVAADLKQTLMTLGQTTEVPV
jgi:chromosome segregation ATPase